MLEDTVKLDHDTIMREARALRAKALADLARSIISFFRRKPFGNAAKA
ncbi:MAG: RSP_7527 family protein [Paracoccaceae bacterium]